MHALPVPACAPAQDSFTGTWKTDATSMHEGGGKPMVLALKDDAYTNDSRVAKGAPGVKCHCWFLAAR